MLAAFVVGLYGAVVARALVSPIILILNFFVVKRIIGVPVSTQIGILGRPTIGALMIYVSLWAFQANFSDPEGLFWLTWYIIAAFTLASAVYSTTILMLWKGFGGPSDPERRLWTLVSRSHRTCDLEQ